MPKLNPGLPASYQPYPRPYPCEKSSHSSKSAKAVLDFNAQGQAYSPVTGHYLSQAAVAATARNFGMQCCAQAPARVSRVTGGSARSGTARKKK